MILTGARPDMLKQRGSAVDAHIVEERMRCFEAYDVFLVKNKAVLLGIGYSASVAMGG